MIGMEMRVDDVEDPQARRFRRRKIWSDITDGIDDGAGGLAAAAEEIRGRHGLGVQELAQDHAVRSPRQTPHGPGTMLQGLTDGG